VLTLASQEWHVDAALALLAAALATVRKVDDATGGIFALAAEVDHAKECILRAARLLRVGGPLNERLSEPLDTSGDFWIVTGPRGEAT
jgi:hypothetical protein